MNIDKHRPHATEPVPATPATGGDTLHRAARECYGKIIKSLAAIVYTHACEITGHRAEGEVIPRSPVMVEVARIRMALDDLSAALAASSTKGPK